MSKYLSVSINRDLFVALARGLYEEVVDEYPDTDVMLFIEQLAELAYETIETSKLEVVK